MRGAAPAALPARHSGQKIVYGCMPGTGAIFRDTVTVSGCLLLRPLRLPAAWRHPVVRPDYDRQLLAHPPVSAEPAGAVSGCRYGPMRENPGLQRPFRSRRLCRAVACAPGIPAKGRRDVRRNAVSQTALHVVAAGPCPLLCPVPFTCLSPCRRGHRQPQPSPPVQG